MTDPGQRPHARFGPYSIEALVGRGGMAEVYRAADANGRAVALKVLLGRYRGQPRYIELFAHEAELSRLLHHPHIVEVLDAGIIEGEPFIAMEYVDGRDLGQVLRRCRDRDIRLPVDFAVFLGVCLLDALACAHAFRAEDSPREGVLHCDVSPSNLFVSRVGEVKLGDFGIALVRNEARAAGERNIFGKIHYLSPEALEGRLDAPADLWAAAVTLYELLTNIRPFSGPDPEAVVRAIRRATPVAPRALRPDLSEALEATLLRAMSLAPSARFTDAAAFADALRPLYDERIGTPLAIAAVVRGLFGTRPAAS